MKRAAMILLAPPVAVCKFGCASCCAAPVTVLWLAGMVAVILGFIGGPAEQAEPSWVTVGLGLALWGISALWTTIATRSGDGSVCEGVDRSVCKRINPDDNDSTHLEDIHRAR
jgi:hypothetical protein